MKKTLVEVGKDIKAKRLALNLRMDDVAKQAGISRATLWSIEKGNGKYTVDSLLNVFSVLGLSLSIDGNTSKISPKERATRINTSKDKKINRFIVMCIEQYSKVTKESSQSIYEKMMKSGMLDELKNDYEDLHGMSTPYLNDYINSILQRSNS